MLLRERRVVAFDVSGGFADDFYVADDCILHHLVSAECSFCQAGGVSLDSGDGLQDVAWQPVGLETDLLRQR